MPDMLKKHWRSLCVFIGLIVAIQVIGSFTTFQSVTTWYATLNKPFWSPPNWVFGPVWTVLYAMLAITGWMLWNKVPGKGVQKFKNPVIACYFAQLLFNATWSPLFFGYRHPECALIVLFLMVVLTYKMMYYSHKNRYNVCTIMLIPYFLWISYALTLNTAIVVLN